MWDLVQSLTRQTDVLVKKLSVIICLQYRANDSTSLRTTKSPSGINDSHFSKYEKPSIMYLLLVFDANQNLMPNLSGLLDMYCINSYLTFVRNNYSSTDRFISDL
ncbi:hypothetical protein HZH68_005982 [Vespula germanica]|uniref:Uncharacterized protein n=1 Tax=Vespula germanica TaxID=30212 RepID=A0A834ND84_VESGE|nr:hypothetical protein HZH68_005982 [Vespula germanica]